MGDIEKIAVSFLELFLAKSQIIEPHITSNDKTPSWDGNIFVYKDISRIKGELLGYIPVQVKGKKVIHFHADHTSYPFMVSDLRNYDKDGGVILFLVEESQDGEKIFFKSLLRSDLKNILKGLQRKNQLKVNVHLQALDINKRSIFENECKNFILNKEKQFSTVDYPLQLEDATEFLIHFYPDESSLDDYLLSHEFPLYGRQHSQEAERFITKINFESLSTSLNKKVTINSKLYYSSFEFVKTKKEKLFKCGKSISINIDTPTLKYKLQGTVEEQIFDLTFVLDMVLSKVIWFGEGKLEITSFADYEKFVDQVKNTLKVLKEIQALFNILGVSPKIFDLDTLDERDYTNLDLLVGTFVYNKKYDRLPYPEGFNAIALGTITLGIFVYKDINSPEYTLVNLTDLPNKLQVRATAENGKDVPISPYVFLKRDFLLLVDNLDLEVVFNSIINISDSEEYHNAGTMFGLELIKAYDISKREIFLETAKKIYLWLQTKKDNDFISKVNEFQIIKRQRTFTYDEKKYLIQLRDQNKEDNQLLCGLSILLDNHSDVDYYLNKLSIDDKSRFMDFPIYALVKN